MSQEFELMSIGDLDSVADWYESEIAKSTRTEFVRFENNTHDFEIEVFLFELRQTRQLPPPAGFEEWTGVTVGGKNIGRGQSCTSYLQKRVIGHFADAGLLNIRHVPTGRVSRTFNFNDRVAPKGRFFKWVKFGIVQRTSAADTDLILEFTGTLDNGEVVKNRQEISL
ncbi:hypothetical protein [Microbulbifer yueqingensis]|uniref:Uncharacterized protein n=1 Tax=Microbulbifer yueqingensis TaxID=658219 RepID=A0A1G8VBK4_9GAMM|nr:hypothetical protein [Microbulbifer yueqingensis]SDJ62530.1 hypothetical protein SAMN05216212_0459 [Microbulbifer yueqingensis]